MVSLVRSGPQILLFKSTQVEGLKTYLTDTFQAVAYDLDMAFERAREEYTLIFISNEMKPLVDKSHIEAIMVIKQEPEAILCRLLSEDLGGLIDQARTAPHIILLRSVGDAELVIKAIQSDLGGEVGPFGDMLLGGSASTTLIALSERPLNRNLSTKDLYPKAIKLEGKHFDFLKELRMHALKYLNAGIGNKDWNEIEIRIFDRYSAYKLHYDRLVELFESMELGLVLGESWSKDYPRLFMSVEVYRVRFFTFHNPNYIKKLLLGMEYTDDGTRIVDFDVYFNHKKIDWTDALDKEDPKSRHLAGLKYRSEIYSRISSQSISDLEELEAAVLKTRT